MATELPSVNGNQRKSFWERPEGTTGMVLAGIGALAFFIYSPAILALLSTTLGALITLGVIGAIVFLALDPKFRNMVWAFYQIFCKKVTGAIIEMDPIAIVNAYLEKLEQNRANMVDQIKKLREQMGSLKRLIDSNESTRISQMKNMKAAQSAKNETQFQLSSRKAGRLENSNKNLNELYVKLEVVYRILLKMYENTGYVLEDTRDEVQTRSREYEAIKVSSNAFRSAMSVINGDKDKKALFDDTMEFMAENIGQRVGEMEHFMDISKNLMDGIDLQNGAFEEDGLKMLEQWEKNSTSLLLSGNEKQQAIEAANNEEDTVDLEQKVPVGRGSKKTYV